IMTVTEIPRWVTEYGAVRQSQALQNRAGSTGHITARAFYRGHTQSPHRPGQHRLTGITAIIHAVMLWHWPLKTTHKPITGHRHRVEIAAGVIRESGSRPHRFDLCRGG